MSGPDTAQQALIGKMTAALAQDERVVSAWLSGSLGRGVGDAWSDVDVTCVVEEEDLAACVAEYSGKRNPMGETVILRALYGRIVTAVTPDWQRYDLAFVTVPEFRAQDPTTLTLLTPPSARPPIGAPRKTYPMSQERIADQAEEFLRVLGLLVVAMGREEYLVSLEGVGLLRGILINLMVEANGKTGERGGVKRLNVYLTPDQKAALEALPPLAAERGSIIAANAALTGLFLPLAKSMCGAGYPQALEDATRRYLADNIPEQIF